MATQTITFNKEGDQYVARFEAAEDFALHIERDQVGPINVEASTIQGAGFAPVDDFPLDARYRPVLDYEFMGLVYPKYIKVTSDAAPAVAEVVSNGEITELKYQEKSVEVTANGNTEVIPDAGFMGLTKVNVSVNVPQSGGGDAPSGISSEWDYFNMPNTDEGESGMAHKLYLNASALKVKADFDGNGEKIYIISPMVFLMLALDMGMLVETIAFCVNYSTKCMSIEGIDGTYPPPVQTIKEYIMDYNEKNFSDPEDVFNNHFLRITEEEFYNLNA